MEKCIFYLDKVEFRRSSLNEMGDQYVNEPADDEKMYGCRKKSRYSLFIHRFRKLLTNL